MPFGVCKVIISGIVFNKRVVNTFVDEVNSEFISMCNHKWFWQIKNENIFNIHLFDNGLHLLSNMSILANNFICRLNYFLRTHLRDTKVQFLTTI